MSLTMKMWDKVIEKRSREETTVKEGQNFV